DIAARTPPQPTRQSVRMEPDEQSWSTAHVNDDFVERMYAVAMLRAKDDPTVVTARSQYLTTSLAPARQANLDELEERGVPVRTLIVWGADDPSARLALAYSLFERVAKHTNEVELHVLARAGHYAFREHPEAFTRLLTGFCLGSGS